MTIKTDELRTSLLCKVISPAQLASEYPLTQEAADYLVEQRREVEAIIQGDDPRLLVIIGPCSIHDTEAALEYAGRLAKLHHELKDDLCILMRVYFEKPRTIVGWKGLISDPDLDGSFSPNKGLRLARKLLQQITELKLPIATEFLDMVNGQYIADLITWGAIGARTTESQIHREMASALSCPVGFKNGTDGNINIAVDAVRAAREPHIFYSPDKDGSLAVYRTHGNPYGHIILRGGKTPNYSEQHVTKAREQMDSVGIHSGIVWSTSAMVTARSSTRSSWKSPKISWRSCAAAPPPLPVSWPRVLLWKAIRKWLPVSHSLTEKASQMPACTGKTRKSCSEIWPPPPRKDAACWANKSPRYGPLKWNRPGISTLEMPGLFRARIRLNVQYFSCRAFWLRLSIRLWSNYNTAPDFPA